MRRLAVQGILAASIAVVSSSAHAAVTVAHRGERELVLIGFAVFQSNLSEQLEGFFDSSDEFPAEFTDRQILNLRLDGDISGATSLEARVHHDRENLRDWRYLARLTHGTSTFAIGELNGAFADTTLTRFDTPFYGLEAKYGLGKLTASGFATLREGNYRVDRLRGSNLSGPYVMSASPVLEGSEQIALEVRDRRDPERLIQSDAQVRGRDYVIDYFAGTILFNSPVPAETFDGDPIQIVVEYQFAAQVGASGSDYLAGTRLIYEPMKGLALGTTYLRSTAADGSTLASDGLVGFDQQFSLGDRFVINNEMAGPGGDVLDRERGAWRLAAHARPLRGLALKARYRRVGPNYETLADPRLDTELDREEWDLDMSFVPARDHRLSAGYGVKTNDVVNDPDVDRTRNVSMFVGWEGRSHGWPLLRSRWERRLTAGGGAIASSSTLDTWSFDGEDELGRMPLFGPSTLKAQYRFERELDEVSVAERSTHSLRARLDGRPGEGIEAFLEARQAWVDEDRGNGTSAEVLLGARVKVKKTLSVGASFRHGRDRNLDSTSNRETLLFDLRFEPSDRFRIATRYELTLASAGDSDSRDRNLQFQIAAVPLKGLTASVGYRLDDRGDAFQTGSGTFDGEYSASLLYRPSDRLTLFGRGERGFNEERLPPFTATRAVRETWLVGANFGFASHWALLGQLKDEHIEQALLARRRAAVIEISRGLTGLLRIGLGVELTLDEQGDTSRLDRERLYLKLVGHL